jgi:hypothetical protein
VFAVLATLMAGALATGALTVVATALPGQPGVERTAAVLGSALVVFAVLGHQHAVLRRHVGWMRYEPTGSGSPRWHGSYGAGAGAKSSP